MSNSEHMQDSQLSRYRLLRGTSLGYLDMPKCASSFIRSRLVAAYDWINDTSFYTELNSLETLNVPASQNNVIFANEMFDNSHSAFTVIRDPFERLLSAYLHLIRDLTTQGKTAPPVKNFFAMYGKIDLDKLTFLYFLEIIGPEPDAKRDAHWQSQVFLLGTLKNKIKIIKMKCQFQNEVEDFIANVIEGYTPNHNMEYSIKVGQSHQTDSAKLKNKYLNPHIKKIIRQYFQECVELWEK